MANLANYTQIAGLVKGWADKIVSLNLNDPTHLIELGEVCRDMHAFSNGLAHTVKTFAPIVAEDNVAESNVAESKIRLTRVVQTGYVSPSQWDAWDAEGNYYYLRYRFGKGSVWAAKSEAEMMETGRYTVICEWRHGHPLDGHMALREFAERSNLDLSGLIPPMIPEEV
ncbi:MAG TPA: hypothetical protein VGH54_15630 [Mycobacterium sp.]|jgi:hypothetical protein|uniref:hypothetical protein n=1 Tax=Mycobacterium sp. TaxID=1785 RepID=UPI002F404FE7